MTRAWIAGARLRRKIGRPPADARERFRERWIRENAPGRSFVDVGGLFRINGKIAFQAEEAGAGPVTLLDSGDAVLSEFPTIKEERGSSVRFVQGDLEDPETIRRVGVHDVVWCTGVIYHSPNPLRQLFHLRAITRELLYLSSRTIPEVPGLPQACIYYPFMDEHAREAVAAAEGPGAAGLLGIGAPFDDKPMGGHANCWWGITPSALRAMLTTARFEVVEEPRIAETPFMVELVARPVDRDPLLPPLSYFRRRGDARERGEEPPPWHGYYEQRRLSGEDALADL